MPTGRELNKFYLLKSLKVSHSLFLHHTHSQNAIWNKGYSLSLIKRFFNISVLILPFFPVCQQIHSENSSYFTLHNPWSVALVLWFKMEKRSKNRDKRHTRIINTLRKFHESYHRTISLFHWLELSHMVTLPTRASQKCTAGVHVPSCQQKIWLKPTLLK